MTSKKFSLNAEEWEKWAKNGLIFIGPALLVLLGSLINAIPSEWKYGAIILYVLNVLVDLLKKFLQGK